MKKLFYFVVVILLLAVGGIFLLPVMLSTDSTRQGLAARVSELTGAQISLNGPVEFSVFPDLGLVADDIEFTLPSGEIDASIPRMVAGVNLLPLLGGKIEITGLELTRPHIVYNEPEGQVSENQEAAGDNPASDPVAEVVAALEKFALHDLAVIDGKFITKSVDGSESVISDINLQLKAPDLDGEILVNLRALNNGQAVSVEGSLSALRPLLKQNPAQFSLAMKLSPAPHPALADVTANGKILLAEDKSYQISDGKFTSLGQPMRLDALYKAGKRPYISFDLEAQSVDLSSFVPSQTAGESNSDGVSKVGNSAEPILDVSVFRGLDMDAAISIGKLSMEGAQVDNIDLQFSLDNGVLSASLGKAKIKEGVIAAQLDSDLNLAQPTVSGKFIASRMNISHLATLADVDVPLSGTLGVSMGYAFQGLSEELIRRSLNAAGKIVLVDANLNVPELKSFGKGENGANISAINAQIDIKDLQQPMVATGNMVWNREPIQFSAELSPSQFLENQTSNLNATVKSNRMNLNYKGRAGIDGTLNGNATVSVPSIDRLLAWLNLGAGTGLKAFNYEGGIALKQNQFAFQKAKIGIDKYKITGSGSMDFTGKPNLTANIALNQLDLAEFTGGSDNKSQNNNNDTPIDLSALRSLNGDIKLKIAKLVHKKLHAGPLNAALKVKNGVGRLSIPKLPLYGGTLSADVTANGANEAAKIAFKVAVADVESSTFLRDAEVFDRMEGKMNAQADIKGSGATVKQLTKSLNGDASMKFLNGAVRGIDVAKLFSNISALMAGGFKPDSSERTEFNELGLTLAVKNGVATTNDLKLAGPVVKMDGAGQIDLGEETIAMRVDPQVIGTIEGQGGTIDVSDIRMPIIVDGKLSSPRIYPDLTEVLKNPQAFLQTFSRLGIDLKKLGGGKLNLEDVLKQGLSGNSDGNSPVGQVGNVISNILTNQSGNGTPKTKVPTNPADLMGALIGGMLKQTTNKPRSAREPLAEPAGTANQNLADTQFGRVPIPIPNPLGNAQTTQPNPAPKSVQTQVIEKVVDQVAPKLNLPVDNDIAKKTLDNVFKQIFQ